MINLLYFIDPKMNKLYIQGMAIDEKEKSKEINY